MNARTTLIIGFCLFLSACGGKENFIVLSPSADGSVGALEISNEQGSAVLEEEGMAVFIKDSESAPSAPKEIGDEELRTIFKEADELKPLPPESFVLYFKKNSNELTGESETFLPAILRAAAKRNVVDIVLIGHTDRVGKQSYNEKLSLARAQAVAAILLDKGVKEEAMQITYHGESNPIIPTEDDVAEPKNRRVEVVVR